MARETRPAAPHVADTDAFKQEFPDIAKIETGDDFNKFVNDQAASIRTSAVDNAIRVAAAFYQAEAKGLVRWGNIKDYCKNHLQYSDKSVTVFKPIFDHRAHLQSFAEVFERKIADRELVGFTVEPRSSLRYVLQTIKANNLLADAVNGTGKAVGMKMGQAEAWKWVSAEMPPKTRNAGNNGSDQARTTPEQRETALKILVAYALKIATLRDNKQREALASNWADFGSMEEYFTDMPPDLIKVMGKTLTNIKKQGSRKFSLLDLPAGIADFFAWDADAAKRHADAEENQKTKDKRAESLNAKRSILWLNMSEARKEFVKWGAKRDDLGNDDQTYEQFQKCRAVYRDLLKRYHPDTGSEKNLKATQDINVAWESISAYYPQTPDEDQKQAA